MACKHQMQEPLPNTHTSFILAKGSKAALNYWHKWEQEETRVAIWFYASRKQIYGLVFKNIFLVGVARVREFF